MTDQQRIAEITALCEEADVRLYRTSTGESAIEIMISSEELEKLFNEDVPYLLSQLAERDKEIEQLDGHIEVYQDICDKHMRIYEMLKTEIARLKAENELLIKDGAELFDKAMEIKLLGAEAPKGE